jgi:hypothetical protein
MNEIIVINEYLQSEFLYLLELVERYKKLSFYQQLIEIPDEPMLIEDKVRYYDYALSFL